MNTYRYTFIAACPGNGEQIIYSLELRHTQKVLVEHIKTACALHKLGHQEDIAADLHTRFGGHLTLRAVHHGVDIETVLAAPAQAQEDARDAESAGRTDAEIVEQTEELAKFLLAWKWGLAPESASLMMRNSQNTKAQKAWNAACEIQELLTATDVENAVSEVDDAARAAQGEA